MCEYHEKSVGSKKNFKNHGLLFHYYIRAYIMLGIGYVAVRRIPRTCYAYLRKMDPPWNRRKDNHNEY